MKDQLKYSLMGEGILENLLLYQPMAKKKKKKMKENIRDEVIFGNYLFIKLLHLLLIMFN